jgi:TatA/E family protein of Tat protein translocase
LEEKPLQYNGLQAKIYHSNRQVPPQLSRSLLLRLESMQEWIVIIVVIGALVIFGTKKIPEVAKSFGRASSEYEKAKIEGSVRVITR